MGSHNHIAPGDLGWKIQRFQGHHVGQKRVSLTLIVVACQSQISKRKAGELIVSQTLVKQSGPFCVECVICYSQIEHLALALSS